MEIEAIPDETNLRNVSPNPETSDIKPSESATKGSERRSSTWDVRNAPKNYVSLAVLQVASAAFSFAAVWVITKNLGADGYGGIVALIAGAQIVQMLVSWSSVALSRFGVEEFVHEGHIRRSFWARTLILLPNLLLVAAFSPFWLPYVSAWVKVPADTAGLIVAYFVVSALWVHIQMALQGAKMPRMQSLLLAVERFSVLLSVILLSLTAHLTINSAMAAYLAIPILVSAVGLFFLRKMLRGKFETDKDSLRKLIAFSLPLIPFSLIGYFSSSYIDAIFISQYLDKAQLGIYGIAYQMSGALQQFLVLGNTLLIPMFVTMKAHNEVSKMRKYVGEIVPVVTLISGFALGWLVIAQFLILPYVFGSEAGEISRVFAVLSLSTLISVPALIGYIPFFISHSATYIGTINAIVVATVNVIANFILIPRFGLIGSALATSISSFVGLIVMIAIVNKKFDMRLRWTLLALAPALVATGAGALYGNSGYVALLLTGISIFMAVVYRRSIFNGVTELLSYKRRLG